MKKPGWVVVYDNGFMAEMRGEPVFSRWFQEEYNTRFPAPPRNWKPLEEDQAKRNGFSIERRESYFNDVVFSPEGLAEYLLTQSNIISAVEQGSQDIGDVFEWLVQNVSPFFSHNEAAFAFGGTILYLKTIGQSAIDDAGACE